MNLPINRVERRGTEWTASGTVHTGDKPPVRITVQITEWDANRLRDALINEQQPQELELKPTEVIEVSLEQ
jgi:hypothetical protein